MKAMSTGHLFQRLSLLAIGDRRDGGGFS